MQRAKDIRQQLIPIFHQWSQKFVIAASVLTEIFSRGIERTFQQYCGAVIQRMRQRNGRINPFQPKRGQSK